MGTQNIKRGSKGAPNILHIGMFQLSSTSDERKPHSMHLYGVKSMATTPLLWPLFLMSRHDTMSRADISEDSLRGCKVVREVKGNLLYILWYCEHTGFVLGKQLDQKNHLGYHVRTSQMGTYHETGEGKAWELDHYAWKSSLGIYLYWKLMQLNATFFWKKNG